LASRPRPSACLQTDDRDVSLADFKGKQAVVLYFYPRDDTPGCTAEACSFRDLRRLFHDNGAEILGVSTDNGAVAQESSRQVPPELFRCWPILTMAVADQYGVWQQRKFMGREYMGIAAHNVRR